jgi:hypothetical protein
VSRAAPGLRSARAPLGAGIALVLLGTGLWSLSTGAGVNWGLLAGRLAGEMLLPVLGLGFAAGLRGGSVAPVGLALAAGAGLGTLARAPFLAAMALLPNASTHAFLTGPLAGLCVGLALFAQGTRLAAPLLALAALATGAMGAIAVRLLDPSFHDPLVPVLAGLALLALGCAACALARALPPGARRLAARILGAWVLAVALLYGGATLAFRGRAVLPSAAGRMGPVESTPFPEF